MTCCIVKFEYHMLPSARKNKKYNVLRGRWCRLYILHGLTIMYIILPKAVSLVVTVYAEATNKTFIYLRRMSHQII
jgi:hypothetical protein